MRKVINENTIDNNVTLSSNQKMNDVEINNLGNKNSKDHFANLDTSDGSNTIELLNYQKEITIKKNKIEALEKEIVNLQNTVLILENDLELNILQNIETIIKQEEFLLELNQIISNLNMKNENYQSIIMKKNKELKIVDEKYQKLKKSKVGSLIVRYWKIRKNIKSR
ncbi:hypothetical protein V7056_09305 [Bacillus sp. JJ664]